MRANDLLINLFEIYLFSDIFCSSNRSFNLSLVIDPHSLAHFLTLETKTTSIFLF